MVCAVTVWAASARADEAKAFLDADERNLLVMEQFEPGEAWFSVWTGARTVYGSASGAGPVLRFEGTADMEGWEEGGVVEFERTGKGFVVREPEGPALTSGMKLAGNYRQLSGEEHLVWAKRSYEVADRALNAAWKQLMVELPEADRDGARAEQRDWIERRDYESEAGSGDASDAEAKETPEYWTKAREMTESRTDFLKIYAETDVSEELAGVYEDGTGGLLTVSNVAADGFDFELNVVRGPTHHTGDLGGRATWDEESEAGRFETPSETEGDAPCVLTFERAGKGFEVKASECEMYHGARAFFDGRYRKARDDD